MASISGLLNSCDQNSREFELLVNDILINNSDVPFDNREVNVIQNTIVTNINIRMNLANTRYNGLVMLDKILSGCSKNTISKHASLWITKTIEILEDEYAKKEEIILACKVLGFLLEYCKEIHELHKQISMQNIRQLVLVIDNILSNEECGAIYYLIAVMLYHYSEVCERSQELIKKMIFLQIDSTEENLINASAKCYVLLSKTTERSFKPPANRSIYTRWTYNQALLCNSLHTIMDELFVKLIELETVDIWDKLNLPAISENNIIEYYNKQKQRFCNLCTYLSSMLCGYDAKNSVVPHDILKVLCRGLAITPTNLKDKTSFKEQMLYIILPKLHISLLTVLNALITGFAQELIPFGKTILNLFQQILQWTSTVLENHLTFSSSKSFKSIRIATYKCLSSWLTNTDSLSGIETIANECFTFIMKDITPERKRILLNAQKPQHWSKRVIKRFKDSEYENSSILNKGKTITENVSLDADLCKEALIILQNIFYSGGVLLKQVFYKNVLNIVVPLLRKHYLSHSVQSFYKNHNECRLELFKVLRAMQMNPHTMLASPIQYYLEISHKAAYDIDLNIAQEARYALVELEKIIHPIAPTLQLPLQEMPDEFLPKNQTEKIATSTATMDLNKRNRIEQELSEETDTMSPACKRSKITMPKHTTVQDGNNIESIEMDDNEANFYEPQTDQDPYENTRNLLQERDVYSDSEQSLSDNNEFTNVNIETGTKFESITRVAIENQKQCEQPEESPPRDKIEESSSSIAEEIQKQAIEEKIRQEKEESEEKSQESNESETLHLFSDIT